MRSVTPPGSIATVASVLLTVSRLWAAPLTPTESAKLFELADPDLVIENMASEPDVVSPVAVAWDADGRMYVAEMIDYPVGPMKGQVRILDDPDDDGRYRESTVFADGLPFPTSVLPYKSGVFVAAAPNIWYMRDTDGDGKADEKKVVLTGFGEGNQQLRVNGLTWGIDNWVYGANGRSDGTVRQPDQPADKAVSIARHDFRFHPETLVVEAITGFGQFGLARDDAGERFLSWNTMPFRHVVIEDRYLFHGGELAEVDPVANITDPSDDGRLFPISPPPQTFNREPIHFFNASCGPTIYRGDVLEAEYKGNLFVCEPLTNLVHRRSLERAGVTFIARRTEKDREFLASRDPWFHPVNLATGPDGCLYVVDFYRQWVEHPQFVRDELEKGVDWRAGSHHGRIWRIRPKNAKPNQPQKLQRASTQELVEALEHPNGWRRDAAQRLLVERHDKSAVELLAKALKNKGDESFGVHAVWALDGLDALDEDKSDGCFKSAHAIVRSAVIRALASRNVGSTRILECWNDNDPRVRLQAAAALGRQEWLDLSLGTFGSRIPRSKCGSLAAILEKDADNPWIRSAALASAHSDPVSVLRHFSMSMPSPRMDAKAEVFENLAAMVAQRKGVQSLHGLVDTKGEMLPGISSPAARLAILAGHVQGHAQLDPLFRPDLKHDERTQSMLKEAAAFCESREATSGDRLRLLRVLTRLDPPKAGDLVVRLMQADQPLSVTQEAAKSLAAMGDAQLARKVLDGWPQFTIPTRQVLAARLAGSKTLAGELLSAMERDVVAPADLSPDQREALRRVATKDQQAKLDKLFGQTLSANRAEVVNKYDEALRLKGDALAGYSVFQTHCGGCHQVQGRGFRVGPDLSGIASRAPATILEDILDPNKQVSGDFSQFLIETEDGQVLSGLLARETPDGVTLRRAQGVEDAVPRSKIASFRAAGKSLMPEGFEQQINQAQMADLLQFLREPRFPK